MISSLGDYFHQVSWGLDEKCAFFTNGVFLNEGLFLTQTLFLTVEKITVDKFLLSNFYGSILQFLVTIYEVKCDQK